MNQWSRNRKRIIFLIVFFTLLVLIGLPAYYFLYRAPTCSDQMQNGDETGIDCGGSCQLLCVAQSLPLILEGDPRVIKVADNVYEIVALVENPNVSAEIYRAGYTLRLYDASSTIPIKVLEGEAYVPKSATFAIFEGPFTTEQGVTPTRAILDWKEETLVWQKNFLDVPQLAVRNSGLTRLDTIPRLDAMIENMSLENVSNIDLTALVSNETGSIVAASKTFVDMLPVGGSTPVVFSWPRPFAAAGPLNIDIIVRIFPDRSFIR